MTKDDIVRVRAQYGRKGRKISRLESGKPVLFDETSPLTADIKAGYIVNGKVVYEADSYAIVRPTKIEEGEEILFEHCWKIPHNIFEDIVAFIDAHRTEIMTDIGDYGLLKSLLVALDEKALESI